MPRSGPPTYVYSLPGVYLAIPGTTITATQHNDPLEDLAATFNTVLPIVWGGTGASSAAAALAALGGAGLTSSNIFAANQTIRLSDDGAGAGPLLTMDRLSATPAASEVLGEVIFSGRDSGAGTQTYGLVGAEIVDPTAANEDGRLFLQSVIAGTLATRAYVGAGIYLPSVAGGDKGASTINAPAYFLNGGSMIPSGFLYGCTLSNNGVDATNDIDFSPGQCIDSNNTSMATCAAMTKQLDANWAAGTNQGMRYSGAAITNTTYHLYAVWKAGGVDQDYYADPSADAPTALAHLQAESGGSAYSYARRLGSIVRASNAIRAFVQTGDAFYWNVTPAPLDLSQLTTRAKSLLSLTVPSGIRVEAAVVLQISTSTGTNAETTLSVYDGANSSVGYSVSNFISTSSDKVFNPTPARQFTNTSGQIYLAIEGNVSGINFQELRTLGWTDTRGRLG